MSVHICRHVCTHICTLVNARQGLRGGAGGGGGYEFAMVRPFVSASRRSADPHA